MKLNQYKGGAKIYRKNPLNGTARENAGPGGQKAPSGNYVEMGGGGVVLVKGHPGFTDDN